MRVIEQLPARPDLGMGEAVAYSPLDETEGLCYTAYFRHIVRPMPERNGATDAGLVVGVLINNQPMSQLMSSFTTLDAVQVAHLRDWLNLHWPAAPQPEGL